MRIAMPLSYSSAGFQQTVDDLQAYEDAGLDVVFLPEGYSFDAVSQLGYLAAKTRTVQLGTGILNIYGRTPTTTAMTAAGLDAVSGGRFVLGLGVSGPQVIEGFHGVPFDAPLGRTREVVEICRKVWRREKVEHDGRYYHLPLTPEHGGSGLGKPLKLINHPVRDSIPVLLAALGPKNVELAAELFDAWEPLFYLPEKAAEVFGPSLASGASNRTPGLGPLEVCADTKLCITDSPEEEDAALQLARRNLALYVGGMGARGRNYYNDLVGRYGFTDAAAEVQELYLGGRKDEAAAAIPDELVRGVSLIGSAAFVASRVRAFEASGASTINAQPLAATHERRLADVRALKEMTG